METEGEERVRAKESLKQLEDAAFILDKDARSDECKQLSNDVPQKLSAILHNMTSISSRDDAERLLAAGVTLWNAVILLEGRETIEEREPLVQVRHVAADCMYMAITVLKVSTRFDITEVSLLKFYTVLGRKYAADLSDLEMATVCFKKAFEFGKSASKIVGADGPESVKTRAFSKAMFDLLLGSAEAAWELERTEEAEAMVNEARQYLHTLPEETEYMASVEFNIGLHAYQQKDMKKAIQWLQRSIRFRRSSHNANKNVAKEAKALRLIGVCHIAQKSYQDARRVLEEAEQLCPDPSGSYLFLKVTILHSGQEATWPLLKQNLEDENVDVDAALANILLVEEAGKIDEALRGYAILWNKKFSSSPSTLVKKVGVRYVEVASRENQLEIAEQIFDKCFKLISEIFADEKKEKETWSSVYGTIALRLSTGLVQNHRYHSAATLLHKAISHAESCKIEDKVFETNMASVYRIAASSFLCAAEDLQRTPEVQSDDASHNFPKSMAVKYGLRARTEEPEDFGTRLLLFRAFLLSNDPGRAAEELQRASTDMFEFDVGALAAAACSAKDAKATKAVLVALECILDLGKKSPSSLAGTPAGFYGVVLCATVELILDHCEYNEKQGPRTDLTSSPPMSKEQGTEDLKFRNISTLQKIHTVLRKGIEGAEQLRWQRALEAASDSPGKDEMLEFLASVSWNAARDAAMRQEWELACNLFDITFVFSDQKNNSTGKLQTMKICRLIAADALIKSAESLPLQKVRQVLEKAKSKLTDARNIITKVLQLSHDENEDSVLTYVAILQAKCLSELRDSVSLRALVYEVTGASYGTAYLLDQLGSICYHSTPRHDATSTKANFFRDDMLDICMYCLDQSMKKRLSSSQVDFPTVAAALREMIKIELSRRTERAFAFAARAVGIFEEHHKHERANENDTTSYPLDEGRWLTATTWETAMSLHRMNKVEDARQWASLSVRAAESDNSLAAYAPRIRQFLSTI